MTARLITLACLLAACVGSAALLTAGPLSPPAGSVAPSYKTLTEVEPRTPLVTSTSIPSALIRITSPGSYYLTGNVTGVSGKAGIEIASNNVTIDLNGYTLQGVAGSRSGISTDGALRTAIIIRNGTIAGWGLNGVDLAFSSLSAQGAVLEDILSASNGGDGIRVPDGASVTRCVAARNTANGFASGNNAIFNNCTAQANVTGFSSGFGGVFHHCVARNNSGSGFAPTGTSHYSDCNATNNAVGFDLTSSYAIGCAASFSPTANFRASANSSFLNCDAFGGSVGFDITSSGNRVESCRSTGTSTGIRCTGTGNIIIRNVATGGTTRYQISAGNSAGPVVTSAGMAANTNPAANFEY